MADANTATVAGGYLSLTNTAGPTNYTPTNIPGSQLGKFYCRLLIGEYKRPSPFHNATWSPKHSILLPLPDVLHDQTSVKYNGVEMGAVGDFINNGTGIGNSLGTMGYRGLGSLSSTAISNLAGSGAGKVVELLGGSAGLGDVIGGAVNDAAKNAFPADAIQTAFEQSLGSAPNPNPSVAFQGPELRQFQYTWTFFPTSSDESIRVKNIISLLKRSSLPKNTLSNSASILNYPDMVQMNFFPWDDGGSGPWYHSNDSIIKMKKCVMHSVDVDYSPSNAHGFFKDNRPVGIKITISFSEIEYMLSSDWEGESGNSDILNIVGTLATLGAIGALGVLVTTGLATEAITP